MDPLEMPSPSPGASHGWASSFASQSLEAVREDSWAVPAHMDDTPLLGDDHRHGRHGGFGPRHGRGRGQQGEQHGDSTSVACDRDEPERSGIHAPGSPSPSMRSATTGSMARPWRRRARTAAVPRCWPPFRPPWRALPKSSRWMRRASTGATPARSGRSRVRI